MANADPGSIESEANIIPLATCAGGDAADEVLSTITALERQLSGLKQIREQAAEIERKSADQARAKEAAAQELLEQLAAQESALAARRAQLEQDENAKEAAHKGRQDELIARQAEIDQRFAECERRKAALEEQAAALRAGSEKLDARAGDIQRQSEEVNARATAVSNKEAELDQRFGRFDSLESIQARNVELQSRLDAVQSQLNQAIENAGQREAAALALGAEESARLSTQIEALRAEIEKTARSMSTAQSNAAESDRAAAHLRDELNRLTVVKDDAERAAAGAAAECANRQRLLERAITAAKEAADALEERSREHGVLLAQAEQQSARIAELEARTTGGEAAIRAAECAGTERISALEAQIAARDEAIEVLARRLKAAEETAEQAMQTAVASPTQERENPFQQAAAGEASAGMVQRRARLRKYRSLLQGQYRKIIVAQNALQKRHADTERILAQRQTIVAAAQTLQAREKQLNARRATGGAVMAAGVAAVTLGVLAVLSWAIAGHIRPGEFVASVTIAADARGGQQSEAALAEWQALMESLVGDPQFNEQAAARFGERGYTDLKSAADVNQFMKESVVLSSARDGQVELEVRSEGAERTRRITETLATTLTSTANATRQQRAGGQASIIAEPPRVGDEPVDHDRLVASGGILGGLVVGVGFFGLVVWSRLSRAKQKFEQDAVMADVIEDAKWAAMIDGSASRGS